MVPLVVVARAWVGKDRGRGVGCMMDGGGHLERTSRLDKCRHGCLDALRARAHAATVPSAHLVCRCVCAHTCPMPVEPSASQHAMDHACGLTILRSTMDERGNGDSYAMIQKRKCKPDATVSLEGSNAVRTVT